MDFSRISSPLPDIAEKLYQASPKMTTTPVMAHDAYRELDPQRQLHTQVVAAFHDAYENGFFNAHQYDTAVTRSDRAQIHKIVDRIKADKETVRILDFGSGNGRLVNLYMELAAKLKAEGKKLEVIFYDVSDQGNSKTAKALMEHKIRPSGSFNDIYIDMPAGSIARSLTRTSYACYENNGLNFSAKIIEGDDQNTADQIKAIVQNVIGPGADLNATLCFDSLAFMPNKEDRERTLKNLTEISTHDLLATFPAITGDKWKQFEEATKKLRAEGKAGMAQKEPESILFNFRGHELFYKLYSLSSLIKEVRDAGIAQLGKLGDNLKVMFGVNQFWHPNKHKEHPDIENTDGVLSGLMSEFLRSSSNTFNTLINGGDNSTDLNIDAQTQPIVERSKLLDQLDGFFQIHIQKS